ncbi:MAG: hypothetical protein ACLFR0_07890 [Alphaproteobacteria bacterium]
MSDNNKIAGRILPKARPLMPDEDGQDEAIIRQYNPGSAKPLTDETDPDIIAARQAIIEAEEKLKETLRNKAALSLIAQAQDLDPDNVAELCEQERWKAGSLTDLSRRHFGFVPEKFEALANEYEEGSDEYERFMAARDEARAIYKKQIMADVRRATAKLDQKSSPIDRRAGYERLSTRLWHYYKADKLEGDPVYKFQGARILWAAEAGLRHQFEHGSKHEISDQPQTPGVTKMTIKPVLNDDMRGNDDGANTQDPPAPE